MGRLIVRAVVSVVLLFSTTPALATNRYFRDLDVRSPNGRYRLQAKSPDNADGGRRPFASGFVYTLDDETTLAQLWKWAPADWKNDGPIGSPSSAFVSDDGWCVIYTGWNQLICMAPETGKPTAVVDLVKRLPPVSEDGHVQDSTAGLLWTGWSRWYFADGFDHPTFVIRTWWDQRIVVNVRDGRLLDDDGRVRELLNHQDRQFVLAVLGREATAAPPEEREWQRVLEVEAAALMGGRMRLAEATPMLHTISRWEYSGTSSTILTFWQSGAITNKDVEPGCWGEHDVRQICQLSLRRLGQSPEPLPATRFHTRGSNRTPEGIVRMVGARSRSDGVAAVRERMRAVEVIELAGPPDFVKRPLPDRALIVWEYDLESPRPRTLRIVWEKDTPTVQSIETLEPQWLDGDRREFDLR